MTRWLAVLAMAVIVSGGAALAQEKERCFLRARALAVPAHYLRSAGGQQRLLKILVKLELFFEDGDLTAAGTLMFQEGIRVFGTDKRVYLVPAILLNIDNEFFTETKQFFRFPGNVEIYHVDKELKAVYCEP